MVEWKAVSKIVVGSDEAQRNKHAQLEEMMKRSEGQPDDLRTAPRKCKSRKRENRTHGSEGSGKTSSQEMSRPRESKVQREQTVKAV